MCFPKASYFCFWLFLNPTQPNPAKDMSPHNLTITLELSKLLAIMEHRTPTLCERVQFTLAYKLRQIERAGGIAGKCAGVMVSKSK